VSFTQRDHARTWLLGQPATATHRRAAAALAAVMLAGFAVVAPFAGMPLVELNAFFPSLDAVVFVTDLVTAVLLFAQYSIFRSRAIFALACGYLFTAFIVVPHALTFAGAFTPSGLLGSGIQTGSWLFIFWHFGFGASLLAYAVLRRQRSDRLSDEGTGATAIGVAVVALLVLVGGLTWLSTAGAELLPHIITDQRTIAPFVIYPIGLTILVTTGAFLVLGLPRPSVLDLWLSVVALVFILELVFSGVLPTVRFSAGFYAGRMFSLVTSSTMLIILLAEMTRLYAELARANAVLQRERDNKLMNLEALAGAIAHEVRQPLSAISNYGSAALRYVRKEPPELREVSTALTTIVESSHRANGILDNIRSLFGKGELPRTQVDVNGVIEDVLRTLDSELRRDQVAAVLELSSDVPLVVGHRGQLQEVVSNLVSNAVEAMQSIRRKRRLEVTTERAPGGTVDIIIADTGPGIGRDQAEAIFDAFVTTKPNGMGLGLAISRTIIERHGGTLVVGNRWPHGATFRIRLPMAGGEDVATPSATSAQTAQNAVAGASAGARTSA
jgi:signal transduction histidine kinase